MSTQHPDNASTPFFSDNPVIAGEAEITEAYYAFSHLGCGEQLWDCEGKESDAYVVKKLLASQEEFFRKNVLGKDRFLTLRMPNPAIEKNESKLIVETLSAIPRSFDVSRQFYGSAPAPIFEVVLPMTSSASELNNIYHYYRDFVAGQQHRKLNGITVKEWLGPFAPETINVIPLFETRDHILSSASIVEEYLSGKEQPYQRVWFARSDPALNYGHLAAVMYNKVALQRLKQLEGNLGIPLPPVIGLGSCPFRGHFKPTNVDNCIKGYPSVQTFTTQSAFKYDYPIDTVKRAFESLNESSAGKPFPVDEDACIALGDLTAAQYAKEVALVAPIVNQLSGYIPKRRQRKLHIGLFGYSRTTAGVTLPRAITFCAALYSVGFPPELMGLGALAEKDAGALRENYRNFDIDLAEAAKYYNPDSAAVIPRELTINAESFLSRMKFEPDGQHRAVTSEIIRNISHNRFSELPALVVQAARVRGFLG